MLDFLQTVLAFLCALGILITAHEYGHFWVAKRLGVKVLRFSIGFGPSVWEQSRGDTQFVVGVIPLGGYVKMLDEREGEVAAEEYSRAFNRKSVAVRSAIVAAGPVANFLLAFCAYWLILVLGVSGLKPLIGDVAEDSVAARAGLAPGDEIITVSGSPTATWDGVFRRALETLLDGGQLDVKLRGSQGGERLATLDLSSMSIDDISEGDFLAMLGIMPQRPVVEPVVARVVPGEPADVAGLLADDRITHANGIAIASWDAWVDLVRSNPGRVLDVVVDRRGLPVELSLTPALVEQDEGAIGRIGAEVRVPEDHANGTMAVERYGVFEAIGLAVQRTAEMSLTTIKFMFKMVAGEVSTSNLSGPLSIAHYAGESARLGVIRFVEFLALVSVSLGVLNLLPVPLLDGGHLLFYLIESVTRRPVPESVQAYGQQAGLVLLLGLISLAIYNDIVRLM